MDSNQLFDKVENSKSIDFGDIFSKSIELFKKVWLQGFVHLLISMVIVIPLVILMYIPIFAMIGIEGFEQSQSGGDLNQLEHMPVGLSIVFVVLVLVVSIVGSAFQLGIMAHFYRVCRQIDLGESEKSNYFMFFKAKYLKKLIVLAFAIFGISLIAMLLCVIPLFYVMVPLQLIGVFFAFNPDLDASSLISTSFKYGNKIWLTAFLLIFISAILAEIVGFILCFVGVFFTMSFIHLPVYYMYKDGIGFDEEGSTRNNTLFVE